MKIIEALKNTEKWVKVVYRNRMLMWDWSIEHHTYHWFVCDKNDYSKIILETDDEEKAVNGLFRDSASISEERPEGAGDILKRHCGEMCKDYLNCSSINTINPTFDAGDCPNLILRK